MLQLRKELGQLHVMQLTLFFPEMRPLYQNIWAK